MTRVSAQIPRLRKGLPLLLVLGASVGAPAIGCGSLPEEGGGGATVDASVPSNTPAKPTASPAPTPTPTPSPTPSPTTPPVIPQGTSWARESVHPLEWPIPTDLGTIDSQVMVEESTDAGATWKLVAEVAVDEQFHRWVMPQAGTSVRARVSFTRSGPMGTVVLRTIETPDVTLTPSQKKSYVWTKMADSTPFGPRDGAGGIVFNGKMWLIGGWNGDVFPLISANDVWSSTDGASWVLEKANTFLDAATFDTNADWEGRHFAGYHTWNGKMWIVGGDVVQGYYQTDVWSSTDGRTWTRTDRHTTTPRMIRDTNPNSPTYGQMIVFPGFRPVEVSDFGLRTLQITGVFQNKLFVMGGQRIEQFVDPVWPGAPGKLFNDVWASADGTAFSQVPTAGTVWSPRCNVGEVVEHQGRMWLIGGGAYDDPALNLARQYSNEVWSTTDGATWAKVPDKAPFSPRVWHNVKEFDGRMWVINGYDGDVVGQGRTGDNLGDVWYSTDGKNWYDASPPPSYVPRHAGTAWVYGNAIYVGSGNAFGADPAMPNQGKWFSDVWRMSPAN